MRRDDYESQENIGLIGMDRANLRNMLAGCQGLLNCLQ